MVIGLDYDNTFTRDPEFWVSMIVTAVQRGHTVLCVTLRHESEGEEVKKNLGRLVHKIVFTGRKAKRASALDAGYLVDVWIDDMPMFIDNSAIPKVA